MPEPAPSGQDASRGMIEPEIVRVAHTGDFAFQDPFAFQHVGSQIGSRGDPSQPSPVQEHGQD